MRIPLSVIIPASAAARSASSRAEATQVASVPTSRGRIDPASPPADVPATGRPSTRWKASGPRLDTRTVSASEPSPWRMRSSAMNGRYPVGALRRRNGPHLTR